jgi:unsaturated rhamnogalacturonyl hydrolase
MKFYSYLTFAVAVFFATCGAQAQVRVGLDNWFNNEVNKKTGQPYHYLWNDTSWSGYSRWGQIFTSRGASIKTIGQPTDSVLQAVDVYIIVDPDTIPENPAPKYIEHKEQEAINRFVRLGGVLIILANDAHNCEFRYLNELSRRFGITFNYESLHPVLNKNWEMGASVNLPAHPVFKDVKKIYIKEISSLSLRGVAKPVLEENGKVLMAECTYGKGFVFAVGDPWIYNEYIDHDRLPESFDNRKAAENLTDYLLSKVQRNKK